MATAESRKIFLNAMCREGRISRPHAIKMQCPSNETGWHDMQIQGLSMDEDCFNFFKKCWFWGWCPIADFSLKVGPLLNGWLCYAHGRQKYRMHGYLILSHPSFLLPWLCHKGITKLKEKWDKFLLNFFNSQSILFSVDLVENYLKKH